MRWEEQRDGCWYAYSGRHVIGMVVPVADEHAGKVVWQITAVQGSKYQAATQGRCSTVPRAKLALRHAWLTWLRERGLSEGPQT